MKSNKLEAWLSFAGHIAVLLGLVALAIEIRNNTSAVRAQELGELHDQAQERRVLALSTDFPSIYVKSLYSPNELSIEEIYVFASFIHMRLDHLQRHFRAYRDGIITQEDWESELVNVPIYLGGKAGELVWSLAKADFSHDPSFVEHVDRAVRDSDLVPDDKFYLELQKKFQSIER